MRTSWVERVMDEDVLERIDKEKESITTVKTTRTSGAHNEWTTIPPTRIDYTRKTIGNEEHREKKWL